MEDILGENGNNNTSFECLCEGCTTSLFNCNAMGNIEVKHKTYSKNKYAVETTKKSTKLLVASIDKIHTQIWK
jgi:hypothetical protein